MSWIYKLDTTAPMGTSSLHATIMQFVVLAYLAAVAVAAPQRYRYYERPRPDHRHYAILRDEREDRGDGNFRYEFETENGILVNAVGTPGSKGQSNIHGFFRFPLDDGTVAKVNYVADEYGFRAESPLIPPLPAHAIEQIRVGEEQRRQGIVWE